MQCRLYYLTPVFKIQSQALCKCPRVDMAKIYNGMPEISTVRRLRQDFREFKDSLYYIVSFRTAWATM